MTFINRLYIYFIVITASFANAHDFESAPHNHNDYEKGDIQTVHIAGDANNFITTNYVQYLGNEALFIQVENTKILFDPFFHHNLGIYQLVPDTLKDKIMNGEAPFNNITAIFISHAHRDHFAVDDMVNYLNRYPETALISSEQAIQQVRNYLKEHSDIVIGEEQLMSAKLDFGDKPFKTTYKNLTVDAVRIPHAGWPSRADVENLVFRVTLHNTTTVMHMGDADPNDDHYLPYKSFWQSKTVNANFPPYWFLYSAEGRDILFDIIRAEKNIGIHVPMKVPNQLKRSNQQYFSKPEQTLLLNSFIRR